MPDKAQLARRLNLLKVDAVTGMQEGYCNKLENWGRPYGPRAGPDILPLWLGGLHAALVLVELPKRPARLKERGKAKVAA